MASLKLFFRYLLRYRALFLISLISMIVFALASLLPPLYLRTLLDKATHRVPFRTLTPLFWVLFLAYSVKAFAKALHGFCGYRAAKSLEKDLRKEVFSHVLRLPFRFFDTTRTGQTLTRLTSDIEWIQGLAYGTLQELVVASLTFLGALVILTLLNARLTLIALLLLPPLFLLSFFVGKRMRLFFVRIRSAIGELTATLENLLEGIRPIQLQHRLTFAEATVEKDQEHLLGARFQLIPISTGYAAAVPYLHDLGTFSILFFGLFYFYQGKATLGDIFAFAFYLRLLYDPVLRFSTLFESLQRAFAGLERVEELLKTREENSGVVAQEFQGAIEAKNLTFGYGGKLLFKDLSFSLAPREKCALVGPSGVGKTTLLLLLLKAYQPLSGELLLDQIPAKEWENASLRSQVGVVLQNDYLFYGSLRENLYFAKPDATEAELWNVLHLACAHDFVQELPRKLDTFIGEKGVRLSGGERQRLCLARALLMNPKLLLLDEATSHVDMQRELLIQEALKNAIAHRSAIIIAHRSTTVQLCQKVLVLEKERYFFGRLEEALSKSPYFRSFYSQLHSQS